MSNHLLHEVKRNLSRKPGLALLVVATIAVGIALLMTTQTTIYQQGRIPLMHIAKERFAVALDARAADRDPLRDSWRTPPLTWMDAQNLLQRPSGASAQSLNFTTGFILETEDKTVRPILLEASATDHQAFSMFDIPFRYGGPWSEASNMSGEAVIVLTDNINQRLFGGANSVGKTVLAQGIPVTVIGVMDKWTLPQRFLDRYFSDRDTLEAFVPIGFAIENNLTRRGTMDCDRSEVETFGSVRRGDIQRLMNTGCGWLNLWVTIKGADDEAAYRQMLEGYIEEQRALGRFPRQDSVPFFVNLHDYVLDISDEDQWSMTLLVMSYLFFLVCVINAVGILLAKFLNHSKRVSLFRALGAPKSYVFKLHLLEVLLLGVGGAAMGLVLSSFGLELMYAIKMYQIDYDGDPEFVRKFYTMDWTLIMVAIAVSITSVVIAGLYPIWKVCNISPASQLKN